MKISREFTQNDLRKAYDQHFEGLRGFLYYKTGSLTLAEDLVQEVFLKVWEKRNELKMENMKGYLFTIAKNMVFNHFRHQKVVLQHENNHQMFSSEYASPEFLLEEKEFESKLNNVIALLPDGCREVFLMNRINQFSYIEIAERLELSVKAIEKRMSKALGILKTELGVKI